MEILLTDIGDGGKISFNGSDIQTDGTFYTPIYSSLFLGDCFYNIYTENKTDDSFLQALIKPITSDNLRNCEIKAKNLLKWLIDIEAVEKIDVFAFGDKNEKINVDITITEPGSDSPQTYSIFWNNEKIVLKG